MIGSRSRYAKVPTAVVRLRSGEEAELVMLREVIDPGADFQAAPRAGDRLDHLAQRYYREPTRWWRICDAVEALDPYEVIDPGVALPIPPSED